MSHRMTQIKEYVYQALVDSGAERLQYEVRGKHPAYHFQVRCPGGMIRDGMYVFSSTPRIDKDLNVIAQAKRYVKELRGGYVRDKLIAMMTGRGHHPIVAEKITDQYEIGCPVATDWVKNFMLQTS